MEDQKKFRSTRSHKWWQELKGKNPVAEAIGSPESRTQSREFQLVPRLKLQLELVVLLLRLDGVLSQARHNVGPCVLWHLRHVRTLRS